MTTLHTTPSQQMKMSTVITDQSQVSISVTFWLGIEQCSNQRRNLVPEESCLRFACLRFFGRYPSTRYCRSVMELAEGVGWRGVDNGSG